MTFRADAATTRILLSSLVLAAAVSQAAAQRHATPEPSPVPTGLLVVAHGADRGWNAGVWATAAGVRWRHGPVEVAFLMGEEAESAGWDSAVVRLVRAGSRQVVVVPLMVSSHGAHYHQVRHYAGELDEMPAELGAHAHHAAASPVPMRVTPALDAAAELGEALVTRWSALPESDRSRSVLLVAHGPTSDEEAERWVANLSRVGEGLRVAGLSRDFRVGLLRDDAPPPRRAAAIAELRDSVAALFHRTGDSVVVLPVMIAAGSITRVRIPADLAGLPIRYASTPLTPHPSITRWIERVAAESLAAGGMVSRAAGGHSGH